MFVVLPGGRAASEQEKGWAPNISAVRATVRYAIATGWLMDPHKPMGRIYRG
jgi:hypothetical protein